VWRDANRALIAAGEMAVSACGSAVGAGKAGETMSLLVLRTANRVLRTSESSTSSENGSCSCSFVSGAKMLSRRHWNRRESASIRVGIVLARAVHDGEVVLLKGEHPPR